MLVRTGPLPKGPVVQDAYQGILQRERRSPQAERGSGSRSRGVRSSSPPGCAPSGGQGSHSCGDRLVACRMWIRASGGKSAARRRLSWARGVRSSSPPGCAGSVGQGSPS